MKRKASGHSAIFNDTEFASRYAEKHQKMARNLGRKYSRKLNEAGFNDGKILDMGCGFGGTLLYLAEQFPESTCTGIDLSEPLIKMAQDKSSTLALSDRVNFKMMDVQNLEFKSTSFDVIINLNMVHLVPDPQRMLNELKKVLNPEGFYFIADLRRSWLGIFETEIKSSYSFNEAEKIVQGSNLSDGILTKDALWWYYEKEK